MIAKKMSYKLGLVFILIQSIVFGQKPNYQSSLPNIVPSGYTKIRLQPEIVAVSKYDLSDIRILDEQNQFVPYFIEYYNPKEILGSKKTILKEVNREIIKGSRTEIILQNQEKKQIHHISLHINNADVSKKINVLGSDNQGQWYSIISNYTLDNLYDNSQTTTDKLIYLPKTNYTFYKIQINDSASPPIVIHQIETYDNFMYFESQKIKLEHIHLQYLKKGNDNLIQYTSDYPYRINEIHFKINEKLLFQRSFAILAEEKYKKRTQEISLFSSTLSKTWDSFTQVDISKDKFKIQVYNNDNQALHINEVQFYQYPIYIVAALDSGKKYRITSGDEASQIPNYDIANFRDKIEKNLPIIESNPIEKINKQSLNSQDKFYQKKWFMWLCIAIGVAFISWISINMIYNLKEKN